MGDSMEQATLGGGCFWCLEGPMNRLRGVHQAVSGYAGGHVEAPTYEAVCTGKTGHAEVVQVTFDPDILSYETLLRVFFKLHDPTQSNRQGPDVGPQYRSIILYHDAAQRQTAGQVIREVEASGAHARRVVTEVVPLEAFHPAEPHHQRFFETHAGSPYCNAMITPKIQKLQAAFPDLVQEDAD